MNDDEATTQTDVETYILEDENEYLTSIPGDQMEYIETVEVGADRVFSWSPETTRLFLSLYKDKIDLFNSGQIKYKQILWQIIADEMRAQNYDVTWTQVQNRFKSLLKSYRNMKKYRGDTLRARWYCPYEKQLTEILSKRKIQSKSISSGNKKINTDNSATLKSFKGNLEALIEEIRQNEIKEFKLKKLILEEHKKIRDQSVQISKIQEQLVISNELKIETNDLLKTLIEQSLQ